MQTITYKWRHNRIDLFLSNEFSYSRNFFHHIFTRWWILVNDKEVKKSYKLKEGDIIQIDNLERFLSPIILEESPNIDLEIKLEKKDYLVIYKPKWILSHPNSIWDLKTKSVVGFLYHKYKNLPTIWNFIRAWIIHRLDKDTNWLMIIVKTEKWLDYFKDLFQKKSISTTIKEKESIPLKKKYRAITNITDKWEKFIKDIDWKLPYYIKEIVKTKWFHIKEFKTWITKILSIRKISNNKLELDIEILTWRTHQIRYHLCQKWLPIIWDPIYGFWEDIEMWLNAYLLEFQDIEWENIKINLLENNLIDIW